MAIVHLAEDHKFHTEVALKMLKKEFVSNENIKKRFLAEARSMFRMSHPHVIRVSDLIDEGDTVAFVMEYVEGETLKEYLERKGKLTDTEIREIFSQMLDAVGYVHEQKLVHRDIKPSNFMIDKNGKIKLMDFGIAKSLDPNAAEYTQTGTGMMMGTPMYMSPEQITETKSVTAQSDIYSLGVVLWQMVTGRKPYDTKTLSNFQLQTKIVSENLADTNTSWDKIIQKATSKDGQDRYKSCQELKQDLSSPAVEKEDVGESNQIDDLKTQVVIDDVKTQVVVDDIKTQVVIDPAKEDLKRMDSPGQLEAKEVVDKKEASESGPKKSIIFLSVGLFLALVVGITFFYNRSSDKIEFESISIGCESGNGTVPCQTWMVSNLNVETFRNGDPIPEAKTKEEWEKAGREQRPAWCYYENDPSNGPKYGKLYNWFAVSDARGLAPDGWRIPDESEIEALSRSLGGEFIAGGKMKNSLGWAWEGNGSNQSGFSGLPGGSRDLAGFGGQLELGDWWTSTTILSSDSVVFVADSTVFLYPDWSASDAICYGLDFEDDELVIYYLPKLAGLSVRCIRD